MLRRARTQEAKESRRLDLIQAAKTLFMQQGFVMPSVTEIVREAQLAKGTFYLYFQTKEELFLELLEMGFAQWFGTLRENLSHDILLQPAMLASTVLQPIMQDACFLQLASMTQSILEQNLRAERATDFKQRLGQSIENLAQEVSEKFGWDREDLIELMMDCYAAIIGTWQTTQVTSSIALIQEKVPYPFLFKKFNDRIEKLVTQIILGRAAMNQDAFK